MNEQFTITLNADDLMKVLLHVLSVNDLKMFKACWSLEIANSRHTQWGVTLLHEAVFLGLTAFVEFMLEKGVNPNVQTIGRKETPLKFGRPGKYMNGRAMHPLLLRYGGNPYLKDSHREDAFKEEVNTDYMESYLVVELVCGKADRIPIDIWRVVKSFILSK